MLANLADKLISNSTVTAEDVANQVADAVAHNRFLVITHRDARIMLLLKRFLPAVVDAQARKFWAKTKLQLDRQDARQTAEETAK